MYLAESEAIKAPQRREARQRLTEEFANLLRLEPQDGARWTGSMTDLVEAAHIVYEQGRICDETGHACSFGRLVSRACRSLNVKEPANPRRTAYKARQRKGIRRESFFTRYCRMVEAQVAQPLTGEITGINE